MYLDLKQKKIDNLSTDIVSLESILTDKKTRGIFGEVNLKGEMIDKFGISFKNGVFDFTKLFNIK